MFFYTLQIIVSILAPWLLKYVRQFHYKTINFIEMIGYISLISICLTIISIPFVQVETDFDYRNADLSKHIDNMTTKLTTSLYTLTFVLISNELAGISSYIIKLFFDWIMSIINKKKYHF